MTTSSAISGGRDPGSRDSRDTGVAGRRATALIVISGDDVYEDLFDAAIKVQEILVRQGFAARTVMGTGRLAAAADTDLVVVYTALGFFPPSRQAALAAAVTAGTGLIVIHSGNVFPSLGDGSLDPDYRRAFELVGSRYVSHGPRPHESRFSVTTARNHPLTYGLADFDVTHEHYHLDVRTGAQVLAWRQAHDDRAAGGREPIWYVRTAGRGRVSYLQLGHDMRVWDDPTVREILGRAARWTCRGSEPMHPEAPR
jgi:uncharacterized protein